MKKIVILIIAITPLTVLGQHLKCCQSVTDVASYLSGIWKLQSDAESFFKYTFEDGKGHLTEMLAADEKGEYIVVNDHPFVEIIQYEQGFKLKYIDLYHTSIVELKYVNAKKMILITDKKEIEYVKISD
ncbi:MAG: hypothetical protein AAF617_05930 [Bacteroidota bacterium]